MHLPLGRGENHRGRTENRPFMGILCPVTWAQRSLRSKGVRCNETACAVLVPAPGTGELLLRVVPSPRQTAPAVHDGRTAASGLQGQDTRQRRPHRQTPSVPGAVAPPPPRSGPPASRCGCPQPGSRPHTARASPMKVNRPVLANVEATEKQKGVNKLPGGPSPPRPPAGRLPSGLFLPGSLPLTS